MYGRESGGTKNRPARLITTTSHLVLRDNLPGIPLNLLVSCRPFPPDGSTVQLPLTSFFPLMLPKSPIFPLWTHFPFSIHCLAKRTLVLSWDLLFVLLLILPGHTFEPHSYALCCRFQIEQIFAIAFKVEAKYTYCTQYTFLGERGTITNFL